MNDKYVDAAELGGLGILAGAQIPVLTGLMKHATPTWYALTADTAKPHGQDVQQPLVRNPYAPSDPQRAMEYENGYEYAMSMGHLGIQKYDIQATHHTEVAWREGFAEAAKKLGRKDIADYVVSTISRTADKTAMYKVAAMLTQDGLMCLNDAPQVTDKAPGILFDVDGTLVQYDAYESDEQTLASGVLHHLMALQATGLRMAAVTNRSVYRPDQRLDQLVSRNLQVLLNCGGAIRDMYFMSHGPTPRHKPAPDMLLYAMEREGIDPANCIYVGDSQDDRQAAAAARLPFVSSAEFFGHTVKVSNVQEAELTLDEIKAVLEAHEDRTFPLDHRDPDGAVLLANAANRYAKITGDYQLKPQAFAAASKIPGTRGGWRYDPRAEMPVFYLVGPSGVQVSAHDPYGGLLRALRRSASPLAHAQSPIDWDGKHNQMRAWDVAEAVARQKASNAPSV
jgi:HAD superfamily hydrolase (TIGR01662 family)